MRKDFPNAFVLGQRVGVRMADGKILLGQVRGRTLLGRPSYDVMLDMGHQIVALDGSILIDADLVVDPPLAAPPPADLTQAEARTPPPVVSPPPEPTPLHGQKIVPLPGRPALELIQGGRPLL